MRHWDEQSACGPLQQHLARLGGYLDEYLRFDGQDAMVEAGKWRAALDRALPGQGVGIEAVLGELGQYLLPNASPIPHPGCSSFITTGATTVGVLAALAASVAAPQRSGLHAFNFVEDLSLTWLRQLFGLSQQMQGIYSSGGSVANLLALGAARQQAFERIGCDPARSGLTQPARVFASAESHHSIQRACAVLGMGRDALVKIPCDAQGRMRIDALLQRLDQCDGVPVALVGNLGTTNSGAIDAVAALAEIARARQLWLHLDGAFGLPGILDPAVASQYAGIEQADSVVVDPHKWLGAPVGIGTTFVRDGALLQRAFTQEPAAYFEGSMSQREVRHSLDALGTAYADMGVELSAPSRGAVVWALLREIGRDGLAARIRRHNAMARHLADAARADPHLELLREPTLSICCFRYVDPRITDLDAFNRALHRRLIHNGRNMPSTTQINGQLAIRPCFIGARAGWEQARQLLDEVRQVGAQLAGHMHGQPDHTGT